MEKYKSYKDSGIEWLGEIPSQWETKRIKDLCKMQSGFYISANDFKDEGFPIYGGNGFRGFSEDFNHDGEYTLIGRQGALCGNINYAKGKFWATEHAIVVYEKKEINKFWFGELLRLMNLNQYSLSAAQPGLSVEKIKRLKLPFIPSLKEQTQIANYLDAKTTAIDKKVTLLEQKIRHYRAYRKMVINEIVTKGLDKTAKLKDSGVDWIGEIPEHWEVKRLKSLGNISTSSVNKKIEEGEKIVFLVNYTDVYGNLNKEIWNDLSYMKVSAKPNQVLEKNLKKGDVLFTPSSETVEDIGVSSVVMEDLKNTLYSYHILRLRFNYKIYHTFKKYMFNNDFVQYYFSKSAKGTTRKILGLNDFNNLQIVLPESLKEQQQIADYLDTKTTTIDKIINNIEAQITMLKELRKTLINEVVTGKVKVTSTSLSHQKASNQPIV
ncbi:restriction endonuclease subunit S [Tenacibaculum maritimum]|uniref:restriction endonuclease subunit S n=1 Tax=Tenacibaculum maritimum TaxID=107401 RepID=UPI00388D122D